MNRTQRPDVLITGGGVVGASSALALAKTGLHVALIEKYEPPRWQATVPDLRVSRICPGQCRTPAHLQRMADRVRDTRPAIPSHADLGQWRSG